MERYNPTRLELAGRDEVARSIFTEVQDGRGTAEGGVYLSVAHLPAAQIEERLPTMLEQFLAVGIDIRKEPMQIHPTMHHMMGGVRTDDQGATTIKGLYAAGEVAGGDHGGNRLGGNALASCQVMGRRAAIAAARFAKALETPLPIDQDAVEFELDVLNSFLTGNQTGGTDGDARVGPDEVHEELRALMWAKVGIKRNEADLEQAAQALSRLESEIQSVVSASGDHTAFNRQWVACMEVENMVLTARAIVHAALLRRESRGAHFRYDYPAPMPGWERRNIVLRIGPQNRFKQQIVDQSIL
jgi:fumarate reductase (CoM/CoB) subunit A